MTQTASPLHPTPLAGGSYELTYGQSWLPSPTPTLNPATVRIALEGDHLKVEARFTDGNIQDPCAKFNETAFGKGDVFELFIRAEGDAHYHEIHVTPGNALLQLRFRAGESLDLKNALVWERLLTSSTERVEGGWVARFDLPLVNITSQSPLPTRFRIACGRYDYQPGQARPIISNTAPLSEPNFHRHHEWPWYDFAG